MPELWSFSADQRGEGPVGSPEFSGNKKNGAELRGIDRYNPEVLAGVVTEKIFEGTPDPAVSAIYTPEQKARGVLDLALRFLIQCVHRLNQKRLS